MRILHHDYGGYPYPADLSRALAARGHEVTHAWCASLVTTPGGVFEKHPDDPDGLQFAPLELSEALAKYSFVKRRRQEREFGALATELTAQVQPDVVISTNMPLDAQAMLQAACRRNGTAFVFWLQDVLGIAAHRVLRRKLPLVGELIGRYYINLEAKLLRRSDRVAPITDDFKPLLRDWGVADERIVTVENWAPLSELPLQAKDNPFAREADLADKFVFLYAGSMGMKHNPELVARLAEATLDRPDVRIVVLSQGVGTDYLRQQREQRGLHNLVLRGFEPFSRMHEVMGAADVLTAVLEPDAGVFSVPSKVLAYLCGGRALLTAMPLENLASRIVDREGAGIVVAPDDIDGFVAGALRLLDDAETRTAMGAAARGYAERTFEIGAIADRFEGILHDAIATRQAGG